MPPKKQTAAKPKPKPKKDTVSCMVLTKGADKISTGEMVDDKNVYFERHAKFEADPIIAQALQERGFVEIMD